MTENRSDAKNGAFFARPDWYDRSINWSARIAREIPVLADVFEDTGGILDAGCGPGHQAIALAKRGYRVTGLDADAGMLKLAEEYARAAAVSIEWVKASYESVLGVTAGGFDGVYTLGNALAASGDRASCHESFMRLGASLRPGGVLFVQVLNFRRLRAESPCARGPRVVVHEGVEYVSVRHFGFAGEHCHVTNTTMWKDDTWRQWSRSGQLYPVDVDELRAWCEEAELDIASLYGSYERESFDVGVSNDLILLAKRRG